MTTTTTHTVKTLDARRAHAQAQLQAIDAQQAQRLAAAEAEAAEQEVVRRSQAERLATLASELDKVDAFLDEQRRREEQVAYAEVVRRQETMERARAFINEPPPRVPQSFAEHQAELRQLDNYVDHMVQVERDRDVAYIDQMESRRLWDRQFAARWALHHPGGIDGCQCGPHRAYRREE